MLHRLQNACIECLLGPEASLSVGMPLSNFVNALRANLGWNFVTFGDLEKKNKEPRQNLTFRQKVKKPTLMDVQILIFSARPRLSSSKIEDLVALVSRQSRQASSNWSSCTWTSMMSSIVMRDAMTIITLLYLYDAAYYTSSRNSDCDPFASAYTGSSTGKSWKLGSGGGEKRGGDSRRVVVCERHPSLFDSNDPPPQPQTHNRAAGRASSEVRIIHLCVWYVVGENVELEL